MEEPTRCGICARPLTDPKSVVKGIGPDCEQKYLGNTTLPIARRFVKKKSILSYIEKPGELNANGRIDVSIFKIAVYDKNKVYILHYSWKVFFLLWPEEFLDLRARRDLGVARVYNIEDWKKIMEKGGFRGALSNGDSVEDSIFEGES